jgi:hypothetical protein
MYTNNIHVLNPGTATTTAVITLGSQVQTLTLTAGTEGYVTFAAGSIGGPVKIASAQPVLAAQRVLFFQTFNEEQAQSPKKAWTTSYFHWFDNATPGMTNDNIHIVNPGGPTANVTVKLGSQTKSLAVPAGGQAYTTFAPNSIGGPITVTADQPVLASQRVLYFQSFNETPATVNAKGAGPSPMLRLMWFDTATPGMYGNNVHIMNLTVSVAHVTVQVHGYATAMTLAIAGGGEVYTTFPAGTIGGPVYISTDNPIIAAQRIQYYQTFNEIQAQ